VPELPEVETVVRALRPHVLGRRILRVEFRQKRVLKGQPKRSAELLAGRRIAGVCRRGKFIVFDLEGLYLTVHLGMTGRLLLAHEPWRHTHAVFHLDGALMLYDDPRQFGRIEVSATVPARVAALGPDALTVDPTEFARVLRTHRSMIKPLLLNQQFLGGMGNIYTDEALFRAGIHPRAIASRLSRPRTLRLHAVMQEILDAAIRQGGSSVSDYVDAEGRKGFFQFEHRVYQKTGEPCTTCGAPIRRILVGQRGTHYCPKCQRR
jgi:formamidopyrimidine-DNA glycosylase